MLDLMDIGRQTWSQALRFAVEVTPAPEQPIAWTTDSRVLVETAHHRLREFGDGGGDTPPLLIVAPEVNGSQLADFAPGQSLVAAMLDAGMGRVCVLEWRSATQETKDFDVEQSIDAIEDSLSRLGGGHLLGICQGGWQSAIVAARRPDLVRTLTLAAAPIDFRAGDGVLTALVDATPPAAYAALVALGGGVMRGELLRSGFTNLKFWDRRVVDRWRLWNGLDDAEWMERRHQLGAWYHARKDLPGRAYLRIVQELFRENRLIAGTFAVHGEPVDLSRIEAPLLLVGGARDHITRPEQLFALAEHAGSPVVRQEVVDQGHIGVVVGHSALRDAWPGFAGWLRDRGGPRSAAIA